MERASVLKVAKLGTAGTAGPGPPTPVIRRTRSRPASRARYEWGGVSAGPQAVLTFARSEGGRGAGEVSRPPEPLIASGNPELSEHLAVSCVGYGVTEGASGDCDDAALGGALLERLSARDLHRFDVRACR